VVWRQINDRLEEYSEEPGGKVIPIVALEFDDMVCFDFRQFPDAPEVVVCDHERSPPWQPHLEKIADSFTEFLNLLKPMTFTPEQEERLSTSLAEARREQN
jgi:SMI1-KNR4 cell-wall